MAVEVYADDPAVTGSNGGLWATLSADYTSGATSLTVSSNAPYGAANPTLSPPTVIRVRIENEVFLVTDNRTTTWTVAGAQEGSTAANHSGTGGAAKTVYEVLTKGSYQDLQAHPVGVAYALFNVKDYGAKGDSNGSTGNGTDDTTAIGLAITAASASGGTVFFPSGIYRVTAAALSITASNVHIRGAGPVTTQVFFDSTDNTSFGGFLFDGGVSSGTITHVSLRDLTVYNKPGLTPGGTLGGWDGSACRVTMRGVSYFLVDNVEVHDAPNYSITTIRSTDGTISNCDCHTGVGTIQLMGGTARVSVVNCHVHDCTDDGLAVGSDDPARGAPTDIVFANNTITKAGNRGIAINSNVSNVTVIGNTVRSIRSHGIALDVATNASGYGKGPITNVTVVGNTVADTGNSTVTGRGATTTGATGIHLSNNVTGTNYYDIVDVVISGNIITGVRNGFVWCDSSTSGYIRNLKVTGNAGQTISNLDAGNGHVPGIYIRNCDNATVQNNTIDGAWHEGLRADANNIGTVTVSGNTWRRCNLDKTTYATGNGMTVTSGVPVVSNNTLVASIVAATESLTAAALDANNIAVKPGAAPGDATFASDTMTKANGALSGTTGQAGPAWAAIGSGHTISTNKAVASPFVSGGATYMTAVDLGNGQTDHYAEASVTLSATANRANDGLLLRTKDASNYIQCGLYNNAGTLNYIIFTKAAGAQQGLVNASAAALVGGSTHTLAARISSTTVYLMLDGAVVLTYNFTTTAEVTNLTGTKVGLISFTSSTADDGTFAFTNFKVTN